MQGRRGSGALGRRRRRCRCLSFTLCGSQPSTQHNFARSFSPTFFADYFLPASRGAGGGAKVREDEGGGCLPARGKVSAFGPKPSKPSKPSTKTTTATNQPAKFIVYCCCFSFSFFISFLFVFSFFFGKTFIRKV